MIAACIKRFFCLHKHSVLRVKDNRVFTECMDCLSVSKGVTITKAYSQHARGLATHEK